jgi:response regulator of citrate/malate metabolism
MGQEQIAQILKDNYPKWMNYKNIMTISGVGRVSTMRTLRALIKREDVEFKIIYGKKSMARWTRLYRLKK